MLVSASEEWVCVALLGLVVALFGCNNNSETPSDNGSVAPVSNPQNDHQGERPDLIATRFKEQLIGTWLGRASINQNQLEASLSTLPEDRREEVERIVREFMTTTAAIDFTAEGNVEQEIEIVPMDRAPIQDGGYGHWKVVETNPEDKQVLIGMKLVLKDGSDIAYQLRFQIENDGQRMSQLVSLGDELTACQPIIIFHKQPTLPTDLAEGARDQRK